MATTVTHASTHSSNLAQFNDIISTLKKEYPELDAEFEANYAAWKATWYTGGTSSSSDRARGEQWDRLVAMTPKIMPHVVNKLQSPDQAFAINLYNRLQTDPDKKVLTMDANPYRSIAQRAVEIYAAHVAAFERHVSAWRAHQDTVRMMSHSRFYLDHESVDAIVGMGRDQVIPLAMAEYAKEKCSWWFEVLYELVKTTKSGKNCFNLPQLYKEWKGWFETSGSLADLPSTLSAQTYHDEELFAERRRMMSSV